MRIYDVFFFSSRRRHTRLQGDWSSDVCSSDLPPPGWTDVHRGGWARAGRPLAAVEADSGLVFAQLMTHDSAAWFGPGFREFAVAAPDSWPALRASGIALGRWWRRAALAWALQSPELARAETDGLLLLWRRDVVERLQRLAPLPRVGG